MTVFDACKGIRVSSGERADANKGKKCPGGYWIPRQKKCASGKPSGKKRLRSEGGSEKEGRKKPSGSEGFLRKTIPIVGAVTAGVGITAAGLAAMKAAGAGEASPRTAAEKQVEETVRRARERSRQGGTTPDDAPGGAGPSEADREFEEMIRKARKYAEEAAKRRAGRGSARSGGGSSEEGDDPFSPNNPDNQWIRNQRRKQSADFQREAQGVQSEFGLGNDPSPGEIKKARKKAAMKYHPDRNREPGATERLQRINEVLDIWEFDAEYRARSGRKDSRSQNMFVDMYARWNSYYGWSY